MKKFLAFLLVFVLVFSMSTSVLAFSWDSTSSTICEEYTIHLNKYRRMYSDYGQAFTRDNTVTANINELVYWSLSVVDDEGNNVDDYEVKYQDLSYCGQIVEGIHYGRVTGVAPKITVIKEEKTPINNLFFNGNLVVIASDGNVNIGGLRFIRDNNDIVTDVEFTGNTVDLMNELSLMGITIDDITNRRVCMSEENLIKNFGTYCKMEETAIWYRVATVTPTPAPTYPNVEIPATGDSSVTPWVITLMVAAGVLALLVFRHKLT